MPDFAEPHDLLAELDAQQDEVLRQLDDLNRRLEQVLAEYAPSQAMNETSDESAQQKKAA